MPREPLPAWTLSEEQKALIPDISGNAINGMGERAKRRPTLVYWDSPDGLPHGPLQSYFYNRYFDVPDIKAAYSADRGPSELTPVAETRAEKSAAAWSDLVKAQTAEIGAEMVGITPVREEWVYEGHTVGEPWLVIMGLVMDQPQVAMAPSTPEHTVSAVEVARHIARIDKSSNFLTNWIRAQGFNAVPRPGQRASGDILLLPAALEAGFGELGKHGSIIHPQYGSSFRLAAVSTNMPLLADAPIEFGADEFCTHCNVCANACPPDAILHDKQWVRGEAKWYVDFDKCVPYFNDHYGCGICIADCPWSIPGVAGNLVEKLGRRHARRQEEAVGGTLDAIG